MDMNCVKVRRLKNGWGVTQQGNDWYLAEFSVWEDAFDYARSLAVTSREAVVEGEDLYGRVAVRQVLSTDAGGVVSIRSLEVA